MSSRLKKIKKSNSKEGSNPDGSVRVKTRSGYFVGQPAGTDGWLKLMSYELEPGIPTRMAMQQSGCPETGEVYVKPFEGRYERKPEAEVEKRLAELEDFVRSLGGMTGNDGSLPAWMRLEFLENTLDFEFDPPCGCPGLSQKMGQRPN